MTNNNDEMATLENNPEKLPEVCVVHVDTDAAGNTSVVVTVDVDVDGETVHGTVKLVDDAPGEEDYCECCYGCWH